MASDQLVIGNFNTSSWSLRPWVLMTHSELPFDEIFVRLTTPEGKYVEGRKEAILAHSPNGFVPALKSNGQTIWDSLAIAETLAERHPDKHLWPQDSGARAHARAISAEMHSGFSALRTHHPMNLARSRPAAEIHPDVARDVQRIVEIWMDCRKTYAAGGPYLFGNFTIADSMYAPVVSRFRTYAIDLSAHGDDGTASDYMETIWQTPAMQAWAARAQEEIS